MAPKPDCAVNPEDVARLLTAARAGCKDSLGTLLQGCHRYLLSVARAYLGRHAGVDTTAADLVQDTMLLAIKGFPKFHGDGEPQLLAWLRTTLINHLRSWWAGQGRQPATSVLESDPLHVQTASWFAMLAEEAEMVSHAWARLAPDHREVLELHYAQKLSWDEIGHYLGRSADAARMLHGRALKKLGDLIHGKQGGEERGASLRTAALASEPRTGR